MLYSHELISFERISNNVSVYKVVVMFVSPVFDLANTIFYAKLKLVKCNIYCAQNV